MSIPDTDMHIGDLYEETLEKYSSGQLKKDGLIMLPEEALSLIHISEPTRPY